MFRVTIARLSKPPPSSDYAYRVISRSDLNSTAAVPSQTSATNETMMPWNGWFSNFLKDKLGPQRYDSLRKLVLYRPDDVMNMEQQPRPSTEMRLSDHDPTLTHKFRQPSPGSQPPVAMPKTDTSLGNAADDPYDIAYYKRDTARRYTSDPAAMNRDVESLKLALLPEDDPRVKEAFEEFEKGSPSSPGNKGVFATGKTDFDPTGLRATMSASREALEKSLDDNMPNHLPTPVWMAKEAEIVAWYEERDLPVAIGGTGFGTVPTRGRIARW